MHLTPTQKSRESRWRDLRFLSLVLTHPLEPTQGDEKPLLFSNYSLWKAPPSPLSSRPKRTWISYFAHARPRVRFPLKETAGS